MEGLIEVCRGKESFDKLDFLLYSKKEIDVIRRVETDKGVVNGEQYPSIKLYYSLYFPEINFREKYLEMEVPIEGTHTCDGINAVINNYAEYGFNDALIPEEYDLEEQARVAVMVDYLLEKEIEKVDLGRQYQNGGRIDIDLNVINQVIGPEITRHDLMNGVSICVAKTQVVRSNLID